MVSFLYPAVELFSLGVQPEKITAMERTNRPARTGMFLRADFDTNILYSPLRVIGLPKNSALFAPVFPADWGLKFILFIRKINFTNGYVNC